MFNLNTVDTTEFKQVFNFIKEVVEKDLDTTEFKRIFNFIKEVVEQDVENRAKEFTDDKLSDQWVCTKSKFLAMKGLQDLELYVKEIFANERYDSIVDLHLRNANNSFRSENGLFGRVKRVINPSIK